MTMFDENGKRVPPEPKDAKVKQDKQDKKKK